MQLKLNIYKNGQVEKTYEAGEFDIMFGTVEDLIDLLDMDKLGKDTSDMEFVTAIVRVVSGGKDKLKEILKEIFPELTDEEMKRVKVKELVPLVKDIVKFSLGELSFATGDKGKN